MQIVHQGQKWTKTRGNGWFAKKEIYKWVGKDIQSCLLDIRRFGEKVSKTDFWDPEPDYDRLREILRDSADLSFCGEIIVIQLEEQANKNFFLKVWVTAVDKWKIQEEPF
mgnify:CR=1 FL=1